MNKADREKLEYKLKRTKDLKRALKVDLGFNILAIDPATKAGWAMSLNEYGVWNLNKEKNASDGMKWLKFEGMVKRMIQDNEIKAVAMELPVSGMHAGAMIHHSKLNCIIEKSCAELKIDYTTYTPSELKKFATLKGNANKKLVIENAQKKLGYEGKDDNEADALWILMMLKRDLS